MPLNPMTGQMEYGGENYNPQNINSGMAMRGMAKGDVDVPLLFDLAESLPSVVSAAAINSRRYANTLLKGGFADVAAGTTGRKLKRAQKLGAFAGNSPAVSPSASGMFMGGNSNLKFMRNLAKKRAAKANATPFVTQTLNANFRPKAFNRMASLTSLTGDKSLGFYTPFQSLSGMGNSAVEKLPSVRNFLGRMSGTTLNEKDKAFSGGILGRIESINRINNIESTIARGAGSGSGFLGRRQTAKYTRALAQKEKLVQNIARVQSLANPSMNAIVNGPAVNAAAKAARASARAAASAAPPGMISDDVLRASVRAAGRSAVTTGNASAAANLAAIADDPIKAVASTMTVGKISNAITSYYAGVVDPTKMTNAQRMIAKRVTGRLGGVGGFASFSDDFTKGGKYAGNFMARTFGGAKMMTMAGQYLQSGGSRTVATKFAAMGATRAIGGLMTPINFLAMGQLVYDIGKGFGKIASRGVNFAKDAMKSMQGSINKPMFGTGFKDNEVAATSRSRGVMAIQNSRLNARSLLGSEAAMMAAHFG